MAISWSTSKRSGKVGFLSPLFTLLPLHQTLRRNSILRSRVQPTNNRNKHKVQTKNQGATASAGGSCGPTACHEVKNRPIRQKWLEMLESLKAYKTAHSTIEIPDDDNSEENKELKTWVNNAYIITSDGMPVTMLV